MTAARTHLLEGSVVVSPFGGSQSGRSACGRKHATGYTLEQALAKTTHVSCERCRVKLRKQIRYEQAMRELNRIAPIAPLPKHDAAAFDSAIRTLVSRDEQGKRAHALDGDGNVRVSARAMHASVAAREHAERVVGALAALEKARTVSREAYADAFRELAEATSASNYFACRAIEYMVLDGEGTT